MNQLQDGLHQIKNWILFSRNSEFVYGFKIKPKRISKEQRDREIKEIIKSADEFCGNASGNSFLKTQIDYNGK